MTSSKLICKNISNVQVSKRNTFVQLTQIPQLKLDLPNAIPLGFTEVFFTCRMPFLSPNHQRQSTEGRMNPGGREMDLHQPPILCERHFNTYISQSIGYWTTRRLPTRGLDDLRTGQLAYWTSHGLDNSWMPPVTLRA